MSKKKFFNPELETEEWYTEVWQNELIQVEDEPNLLVRNHYWQDANGDMWGNFDDPMENVRASFAAYRMKKGYMTPNEIRALRHNLELSVSDFSERIGIMPATLTQIESDQCIQLNDQEIIFKSARDYYEKHEILPED